MREFSVTIPYTVETEDKTAKLVEKLCAKFADSFGGFTVTEGKGGWHNGESVEIESLFIVTVAVNRDAEETLEYGRMTAKVICAELSQACVYFRNVDGNVYLLD